MTAPAPPAADPAEFPLPAAAAALLSAGRAVVLTHAATGQRFRLAPAGAADPNEPGEPGDFTREAYAAAQLAADGGERLTELEALRRAVAFNEAEAAAGRGPLTRAEADAELEAEFPQLKAHRERRRDRGRP